MTKDIAWQECDVHFDNSKGEENWEDESDLEDVEYNLFAPPSEDEFEIFEYDFPQLKDYNPSNNHLIKAIEASASNDAIERDSRVIKLRGHSEINNSTGLSMWLGSEKLCEYLLDHPELVHGQRIMELGAGLGLCSITCCYLGAKQVLITDGDSIVLSNLRHNVKQNIPPSFCDDTIVFENASSNENESTNDNVCAIMNTDQGKDQANAQNLLVSCPQHIWGKNIETFENNYGKSNVLIATDCVYITQSLEPLWESIDKLLMKSTDAEYQCGTENVDKDSNFNEGIFLYTNRCSSAAPIEMVLDMAIKYGFTWSKIQTAAYNNNNSEDTDGIYLFRRKS